MAIKIIRETFQSAGKNDRGTEVGTVKVNLGIRGEVEAKCIRHSDGQISVAGFVGRYRTSPKPWAATVMEFNAGVFVNFGRDDRSGRFNKQNAISWEPETYFGLIRPGHYDAV